MASLIDLMVSKHAETDKAVLVSDTGRGDEAVWLPKSQIEIEPAAVGGLFTVTLPEWLAKDKGLI